MRHEIELNWWRFFEKAIQNNLNPDKVKSLVDSKMLFVFVIYCKEVKKQQRHDKSPI